MTKLNKEPRRRIKITKGQLVASTDLLQNACARVLTVIHVYRERNYKRMQRYVQNEEPNQITKS
jgi:hypothetical protein